jgi:hypothetical protein
MSFRQWRIQLRIHHGLALLAAGHSEFGAVAVAGCGGGVPPDGAQS